MSVAPLASAPGTGAGPQGDALIRALTARDGFAIVVGSVIGSGIFLVPGSIATQLGSLRSVLLVWTIGGLLSLFGALSLAEMGSMFPAAGGLYTYLREAYGRPVAFLYGWGLLSVIHTGTIATLAAGFGVYVSQLFALSSEVQKLLSEASVAVLTALNLMSVRHSRHIQNLATAAKLFGIFVLGALLFLRSQSGTLSTGWNAPPHAGFLAYGVALIAVLWAYEGWHAVSFTAGEFRAPQRDLPRCLIYGTVVVSAIFLLLNIAYYTVLRPHEMAGVGSAAASAMRTAYGVNTTRLVSALIVTSILGAMNGNILTGPRVYYAMARDGLFFRALGRTSAKTQVPAFAIVVQGLWAAVLIMLGSFQQLFTCVIFTAWIFYGLAVAGVIVLRYRTPGRDRPFRTPVYPAVPILFVIASAAVVLSTIASQPVRAMLGIAASLVGLPLYFLFLASSRRKPEIYQTPEFEK